MKFIIVRHGHPDYVKDCLTELGHLHGEAVAERLADEKIDAIFSSTGGRAYETAEHIAKRKGMNVEKAYDFIREMDWSTDEDPNDYQTYNPWLTVWAMISEGKPMDEEAWAKDERVAPSRIVRNYHQICEGLDAFLEELGYTREGLYYRVGKPKYDTVVMVCHGGASSAVFAHLYNLPFPFALASLTANQNYTAISEVYFTGEEGDLILPRFGIQNDAKHIEGIKI